MRSGRRASVAAFVGAAVAIGFGSYAWACGPNNPHSGLFWLCNQGLHCSSFTSLTVAPSNSVKWGRAVGLSTGSVTYDMKWTSGSHLPSNDTGCPFGANSIVFAGGGNLLPDSTGSIGAATLTMPNFLGVITRCIFPGGYGASPPTSIIVASNSVLTLT